MSGFHPTEPVPATEGRRADLSAFLPSQNLTTRTGDIFGAYDVAESGTDDAGRGAPQARPEPAAAPSSSRLDKGTICDRAPSSTVALSGPRTRQIGIDLRQQEETYRVVLRNYGDELAEASVTVNNLRPRKRKSSLPRELTEEQKAEHRERAVRRARTTVRQTIMAAKLDHLLTLTYRENQTDTQLAWKHFARFMRLLRKQRAGRAFPFVAVLERQKRGAIHVHLAVAGYQNVALLRALWHEAIGTIEGNIDVQFFRQRLPTLARYLSKYITKDIRAEHVDGDHRYKRARGIAVPKAIIWLPLNVAIDENLVELFESCVARIKFHINMLTTGGPRWLWACSW